MSLQLLNFAFVYLHFILHSGQHLACVDLEIQQLFIDLGVFGLREVT
jgi:hypothetical protein